MRGWKVLRPLHISHGDLWIKKVLEEYRTSRTSNLEYKPEKDETDGAGAFDGGRQGCEQCPGALGSRMDHAIGNIQLMYQFSAREWK